MTAVVRPATRRNAWLVESGSSDAVGSDGTLGSSRPKATAEQTR